MASIYKRAKSPFWWIKFSDPTNPKHPFQQSTGFRHTSAADTRRARELEATKTLEERRFSSAANHGQWDCWVPDFIGFRYQHRPASKLRYTIAWRTLRLYLDQHEITLPRQLTRQHCQNYFSWRPKADPRNGKYAAGHNTALTEIKLLGLVMEEAVARDFATRNPCHKLGVSRHGGKMRPELSDDDYAIIERAIAAEPEPRRTAFLHSYLIARYHGVRLSETHLNPMTDVELWTEITTIPGGCTFAPRGFIRFTQKGQKQTNKPLHPHLIPLFHKLRDSGATETYPKLKSMAKEWFNLLTRCGIKARVPNACFHSLRVSAASRLARNGVPMRTAMEYLSHASTTVHQSYVRWRPEDVAECHKGL